METLAPRASYDRDELGITDRMPLFAGTIFGAGMGASDVVDLYGEHSLRTAVAYGLVTHS
jgi:hypothetical protein